MSHWVSEVAEAAELDRTLSMRLTLGMKSIIMGDIAAADAAMSQGVTLVNWSNEERTRFRKVAMIEWDAFGKKSPLARKLVDSQVAFLKKLHLLD